MQAASPRRDEIAVALAPAVFVVLWSTGFIGAKFGLPHAEPLTFLALRFLIVFALLTGVALLLGVARLRGESLRHNLVSGGQSWASIRRATSMFVVYSLPPPTTFSVHSDLTPT